MNKLTFFLVALFECDSCCQQQEFPGKLKGLSAATLQPLCFLCVNSFVCILHLISQKEGTCTSKFHRAVVFRGVVCQKKKRSLFGSSISFFFDLCPST